MPCAETDPGRPHRTRQTKENRKPLPVAVHQATARAQVGAHGFDAEPPVAAAINLGCAAAPGCRGADGLHPPSPRAGATRTTSCHVRLHQVLPVVPLSSRTRLRGPPWPRPRPQVSGAESSTRGAFGGTRPGTGATCVTGARHEGKERTKTATSSGSPSCQRIASRTSRQPAGATRNHRSRHRRIETGVRGRPRRRRAEVLHPRSSRDAGDVQEAATAGRRPRDTRRGSKTMVRHRSGGTSCRGPCGRPATATRYTYPRDAAPGPPIPESVEETPAEPGGSSVAGRAGALGRSRMVVNPFPWDEDESYTLGDKTYIGPPNREAVSVDHRQRVRAPGRRYARARSAPGDPGSPARP